MYFLSIYSALTLIELVLLLGKAMGQPRASGWWKQQFAYTLSYLQAAHLEHLLQYSD